MAILSWRPVELRNWLWALLGRREVDVLDALFIAIRTEDEAKTAAHRWRDEACFLLPMANRDRSDSIIVKYISAADVGDI